MILFGKLFWDLAHPNEIESWIFFSIFFSFLSCRPYVDDGSYVDDSDVEYDPEDDLTDTWPLYELKDSEQEFELESDLDRLWR